MPFTKPHLLVDVHMLAEQLGDENLCIVDCGWDVAAYGRAHIPGAVSRPGHPYIKAIADDGSTATDLPGPGTVKEMCRTMGIGPETNVVIYDDWGTLFATRLWWVLMYYGFDRVRVLDGGWQAWVAAGLPVSFEVPAVPDVEDLELEPDPRRIIRIDELMERHADDDLHVLDVRSDDEFKGVVFRGNKRKGRIPGATHLEWNRLLENSTDPQAVRTLRAETEVDALIAGAELDPSVEIVTHCQAAIRATHTAFVLEMMGYPPVRVYDGSMEEWAGRTDTPLVGS